MNNYLSRFYIYMNISNNQVTNYHNIQYYKHNFKQYLLYLRSKEYICIMQYKSSIYNYIMNNHFRLCKNLGYNCNLELIVYKDWFYILYNFMRFLYKSNRVISIIGIFVKNYRNNLVHMNSLFRCCFLVYI